MNIKTMYREFLRDLTEILYYPNYAPPSHRLFCVHALHIMLIEM